MQAICTSPPYFGLRAYQGDQDVLWPTVEYSPMPGLPPLRIQGCEPGCEHVWKPLGKSPVKLTNGLGAATSGANNGRHTVSICQKCGGVKCPLGLEPTIESYIAHLILCLREWRRCLRGDGLCFVNLGDSYVSGGSANGEGETRKNGSAWTGGTASLEQQRRVTGQHTVKPKNLLQIPARFALAAQADGWWLRSALPWLKRNGMPESATDRPSQVVESVFILAKSENYYFDMQAIAQPIADASIDRLTQDIEHQIGTVRANGGAKTNGNFKAVGSMAGRHFRSSDLFFKTWQGLLTNEEGDPLALIVNPQPYSASHFAVFPPLLPEIAIKCSTSEHGCCSVCGSPYRRVVERKTNTLPIEQRNGRTGHNGQPPQQSGWFWKPPEVTETGWQPTCSCNAPIQPCTVLDPFVGSGTTLQVSVKLGRHAIGVDLSAEYLGELVPERMDTVSTEPIRVTGGAEDWAASPLFAEVQS